MSGMDEAHTRKEIMDKNLIKQHEETKMHGIEVFYLIK